MSPSAPGRRTSHLVAVLLLAFVLHAAYDSRIAIWHARPSLALAALLTVCVFTDGETGAWLGFVAGLLEASYAKAYIGSYIVTRTLAGFLTGLLEERIFRDNVLVAVATVFVGTLFTDTCFFLFAPQPHALRWFAGTVLEATYNAALAVPLFFLIRRLRPKRPGPVL